MDEERLKDAEAALDESIRGIRMTKASEKEMRGSSVSKRDIRRLAAALAIALSITASLAAFFLFLSGSGDPPVLSIGEQEALAGKIDGFLWECRDEDAPFRSMRTTEGAGCLYIEADTVTLVFIPSLFSSIDFPSSFRYRSMERS